MRVNIAVDQQAQPVIAVAVFQRTVDIQVRIVMA
jgi:hypothetical protein